MRKGILIICASLVFGSSLVYSAPISVYIPSETLIELPYEH